MALDFISNLHTLISKARAESTSEYSSVFECGFNGALTSFSNFSRSFMLLLVFFVVLDVEVVLLLSSCLEMESYSSYPFIVVFILVVLLGFYYEIHSGLVKFT
uniref:NADH dehydrogenase subunit 3 n=1 Tax=Hexostoma thynni TaxID=92220 RepID=UPI0022385676|nr:NADH dehydrogenase subunit 3 [Hexostoma thynni]UYC28906.1 NADH dehydrogenase subunit 3 [Hexostoma thynni]